MKRLPYLVLVGAILLFSGCSGGCNVQPGNTATYVPKPQPFDNTMSKSDMQRAKLIKYISKRTVRVVCRRTLIDTTTNAILSKHQKCGWGTGTIIRSEKSGSYILTAEHVVNGRQSIYSFLGFKYIYYYLIEMRDLQNNVKHLHGGSLIVMRDKARDIAVLKIPKDLKIQSSVSHNVVLGQEAHVMGYPWLVNIKGSHLSYTHGYVGTMYMGNDKKKKARDHDRMDMDVYMGNSGSAVWDNSGRIIGMVNWVTGMRFSNRYFLPQPKQTYGCSARGILKSLKESKLRSLRGF